MRSLARLLVAAVVATGVMVTVPTAAEAGWHGCVTKREYKQVHPGMRKKRVHRVFDTSGRKARGWSRPTREYRACSRLPAGAPGYLMFYRANGRLNGKAHMITD